MSCVHTYPKGEKDQLDPYGRKGIFIGYSDTSKDYWKYFPGFKKIDISRDVTFDEDLTYFRSRRTPIQEVEEHEETIFQDMKIRESIPEDPEDHDMKEP